MSDFDNQWKQFQKQILDDNSKDQKVFKEDGLVLVDNEDESLGELLKIALIEYGELYEVASKVYAELEALKDKVKNVSRHKINRKYQFFNKDSWMERQNKIAELNTPEITRSDIRDIENSSIRYYPEIFNAKNDAFLNIPSDINEVSVQIANMMAQIQLVMDNPNKYLDVSIDIYDGEAPF